MKIRINNEIKIGIMVFVCIAALLILTFQVGNFSLHKKTYELKVQFQNINGIELYAPVRLNGFEVGSVNNIKIVYDDATKMLLTLGINEGVKVHDGAKAYVRTLGLIGEKYIGLTDEAKGDFLPPGSLIVGEEPVDMEQLLAKGDEIANNLNSILVNVDDLVKTNKDQVNEIVVNVNSATKNLDEFSDDVKRNPWKLLFRSKDTKKQ